MRLASRQKDAVENSPALNTIHLTFSTIKAFFNGILLLIALERYDKPNGTREWQTFALRRKNFLASIFSGGNL